MNIKEKGYYMIKKNEFVFWNSEFYLKRKESISIVLLAHVKAPRGKINENQIQCASTERFSIDEFNEIYQGIVNSGYYIQSVYFNELDFISEYIDHPQRFDNCLIYNLARNGLGNNKKTLVPSFCELVGLKYTSSSALSCSICRDKYIFTSLLDSHKIPVPNSWFFQEDGTWLKDKPVFNTRIICKPCSESASQGINETKIFSIPESGFENNLSPNSIVQEYISGEECEVPVFKIGNRVISLPPVGINLKGKNILDEKSSDEYDYEFYDLRTTQSLSTIDRIMQLAKEAFNVLQMDVYGRVDFRINQNGEPFIFDVSTTPYTVKHSSFAFAFKKMGLEYFDIYSAIISAALRRK